MPRYDLNRHDETFLERIISWLLLATVALAALAGVVAGAQWAWHHFMG